MRILVTGSRAWYDWKTIMNAFQEVTKGVKAANVTVVHGGARGADVIAGDCAAQLGFTVEEHPANWDSCGPDCNPSHFRIRMGKPYCPRSGYVRNSKMVNLGADICLAFIRNDSKGTKMCVELADKAGIPVHRYVEND